jgi:hypothetical protein
MTILLFWVVTPCRQGGRYQSFGEIYCLCLQVVLPCRLIRGYQRLRETYCLRFQGWRWRQYVSPKRWYLRISLHGVTFTAENLSLITTDVRIANNVRESKREPRKCKSRSLPLHQSARYVNFKNQYLYLSSHLIRLNCNKVFSAYGPCQFV